MRFSVTFTEDQYSQVIAHLFKSDDESAAYILCGLSESCREARLLAREVLPVDPSDILQQSHHHMKIASRSFLRALKRADMTRQSFMFVHSHPSFVPEHSGQDDAEEKSLFRTAHNRIREPSIHGSIVFSSPDRPIGRVWLNAGSTEPIDCVRVTGHRLRLMYASDAGEPNLTIYDRQIRAFGKELQDVLKRLIVGVVGAGGTGSSVVEQLVRLGVGTIVVADGQRLEASNVTRGYGSRLTDVGAPKDALAERLAFEVGLGTHVRRIERPVTFRSALEAFRECDVIFGCTDDQWGRSLLTRLSVYYYIPVLDMGVKIDSAEGQLHSIQGRVTKLFPGSACLFCRNRISTEGVRAEVINAVSPGEAETLREEGYAPELAEPAPAVIPFTTGVAAAAVAEFLHMLTGFMGNERRSTEIILRFDRGVVRTNSTVGNPECFCGDREKWGLGDRPTFLDSTWRPE